MFVRSRSLRERITATATALFAFAVAVGAVLLIALQKQTLLRSSDTAALKTAHDVAVLVQSGRLPTPLLTGGGGDTYVQVVDAENHIESFSFGADGAVSLLSTTQLAQARGGARLSISVGRGVQDSYRVVAVPAGQSTVVVASSMSSVEQSIRLLRTAALFGAPFGVLVMALVTYWIVGQTLAPVATLRAGAEEITMAGLAARRLKTPVAHDEIYRLAVTLNAMLDRLDSATSRQRTFVGDAAHELRSPIASARLQLEVAQRLGEATDWNEVATDVLTDIDRLQRLVDDLLVLARLEETEGALGVRERVDLAELATEVSRTYSDARVPLRLSLVGDAAAIVNGDPDGLRRILVNLLDNAVRYATTEVDIALTSTKSPRPSIVVTIGDDGPGIAVAERSKVFDRFYRVAASRSRDSGGTGLGLAIVGDLVRSHGGTITLEDNLQRPGQGEDHHPGLLVRLTFPLAP